MRTHALYDIHCTASNPPLHPKPYFGHVTCKQWGRQIPLLGVTKPCFRPAAPVGSPPGGQHAGATRPGVPAGHARTAGEHRSCRTLASRTPACLRLGRPQGARYISVPASSVGHFTRWRPCGSHRSVDARHLPPAAGLAGSTGIPLIPRSVPPEPQQGGRPAT
jgi:hypothetical protein